MNMFIRPFHPPHFFLHGTTETNKYIHVRITRLIYINAAYQLPTISLLVSFSVCGDNNAWNMKRAEGIMEALETRKDDKWHPNRERSSATGTISDIYTYDVVVGGCCEYTLWKHWMLVVVGVTLNSSKVTQGESLSQKANSHTHLIFTEQDNKIKRRQRRTKR